MGIEHKIVLLMTIHFVADFILQNDWMALNKSKQFLPLFIHVSLYSICFLWLGIEYALLNFFLHLITDFVTSRVTSRLWLAGKRHWFFVVVGLDQLIHQACLIITLGLIK